MKKIQYIWLQCMKDEQIYCEVGKNGVTEIKKVEYNPEPFCTKMYFEIYKESGLSREIHRVDDVKYFDLTNPTDKE